jgi:L-threonylcarbamoyladenylate synthase
LRDNFCVKTKVTRSPDEAAEYIKLGGIVAFPTETVYGLGADVFNATAVRKIFEAKQRPADNPLIAHVGDKSQIVSLADVIPEVADRLIAAFFPGPLTVVLPKSERVPLIATAGLETIGVRMPANTVSLEFLAACATPIVAPSANLSGRPSPTTWRAVLEDLDGRVDCILQGEPTLVGLESTVVDCTTEAPLVLRTGAVSLEQLRGIVPQTKTYEPAPDERPRSPGVKHKHYSPNARVWIVDSGDMPPDAALAAYIGLEKAKSTSAFEKICSSVDEYAHEIFEFFRECDRRGIACIYCQKVDETGIGAALMDRIRRAAAGD